MHLPLCFLGNKYARTWEGARWEVVVEGLAEGNDTASYFLPVHAESACRRYRSRPSSLALPLSPSLFRSPVHNLKKELGVLGWVGLTVYTGDRVDAIPSFVRRLGCTAFYGARGWTIRTRPRSKDDNKLMQQRCSTEKRKNRCIYGVTSLLCEMSRPALCASVHQGFVTIRYSATRTNGPECTRRRRRDTNRAMGNMKRALQ